MKFVFEESQEFGRYLYKPLNKEAQTICEIAKVKNLVEWQMNILKDDGFALEIRPKKVQFDRKQN